MVVCDDGNGDGDDNSELKMHQICDADATKKQSLIISVILVSND